MSPFFFMLALYGLLHAPGLRRWPGGVARWEKAAGAMGVALVLAGIMHFVRPDLFLPMVPTFLPSPELVVLISGIIELAIGIMLLVPRTRRLGGFAAAAFFLAIWPGSIHMAISGVYPPEFPQTPLYHWARLPFQLLYIGWGLWIGLTRVPVRLRPARPAAAE